MRVLVFILTIISSVIISAKGQTTDSVKLVRDTVTMFSLYYSDPVQSGTADRYTYILHNGQLYNASKFIDDYNDGCVSYEIKSAINNDAFSMWEKYRKGKISFLHKSGSKTISYKCYTADILFFISSCDLTKSLGNPLESLVQDKLGIIHIVTLMNTQWKPAALPASVVSFVKGKP